MSASRYIGRVGGLAAAMGVGAAIVTGAGAAWAGPASPDSSAPSATDHRADATSDPGPTTKDAKASGDDANRRTLANVLGVHPPTPKPAPKHTLKPVTPQSDVDDQDPAALPKKTKSTKT